MEVVSDVQEVLDVCAPLVLFPSDDLHIAAQSCCPLTWFIFNHNE